MPAADTAKIEAVAAVRAAFNSQIAATDQSSKLLNAAVSQFPELRALHDGARAAVANLERYGAIIRAAVDAAGRVEVEAIKPPLGTTNLTSKKFYPGKNSFAPAIREGQAKDIFKLSPGGDYEIDTVVDGKTIPILVTV